MKNTDKNVENATDLYCVGIGHRKIFTRWWLRTRILPRLPYHSEGIHELYVPWWAWPLEKLHIIIFGSTKLDDSPHELERKAKLWDALISNQRIRVIGSAKLGKVGYQHIGLEIWTQYGTVDDRKDPEYCENIADETEKSIGQLTMYLDALIKTNEGGE